MNLRIRSRSNKPQSTASHRAYHFPVRVSFFANESRDSSLGPRIFQRVSLPVDLALRSRRFRDFPVSRPCVTPAIATATLMRLRRSQSTHTRRIAALMPGVATATVMAMADPRTSSQRIPSSNHTPTDPDQHTWRSLSKSVRSNAGQLRSASPV